MLSVRTAGALERTDELFSLGVLRQGACGFIEFPVCLQSLPQTCVGVCGGRRGCLETEGGQALGVVGRRLECVGGDQRGAARGVTADLQE